MDNAADMSQDAGTTDELIEFLSLRMFPEKLTISAQSDVVAGARKAELEEYLEGVAEYEDELRALSPEALMQLIEDEQQRDAEAEQEEAERLENERFFNKPTARAYYRSWVERNYWTLDEATALILGKDPKVVNWDSIDPLVHKSPFARRYESLRRQFLRARFDGMLYEPLVPADFLRYANSVGFALPVELDRLLRSDDEEQERQKRQAMDSIKLAELKKAIELAAIPPAQDDEETEVEEDIQAEDLAASEDADEALDADAAEMDDNSALQTEDDASADFAEGDLDYGKDREADEFSADSVDSEDASEDLIEVADEDVSSAAVDLDQDSESFDAEQEPSDTVDEYADDASEVVDDSETVNGYDAAADVDPSSEDNLETDDASGESEIAEELTMNGEATELADSSPDENDEGASPEEWYFPDEETQNDYQAERQTFLNMIVAMAAGRYGHELDTMRDSTIADIVRDHQNIGLACNEDAIRALLQEASEQDASDPT